MKYLKEWKIKQFEGGFGIGDYPTQLSQSCVASLRFCRSSLLLGVLLSPVLLRDPPDSSWTIHARDLTVDLTESRRKCAAGKLCLPFPASLESAVPRFSSCAGDGLKKFDSICISADWKVLTFQQVRSGLHEPTSVSQFETVVVELWKGSISSNWTMT